MSLRRWSLLALCSSLLGCRYHISDWTGEVKVTARERESIVTCGSGKLTDAGGKRISRTPYLQSTTTTTTTVTWGSTDGRGAVVLRRPDGQVVATAAAAYAGLPARREDRLAAQHPETHELAADDIYLVKARLTRLEPTTLYCYQIVADGVPLTEPAPLTTAAASGLAEPVRFIALGDTGSGSPAQLAIARQMSAVPFDFLIFLGDIAYESGTAAQIESRFFAIYRDFLRYTPVYPAMGNHERRTRKGQPYLEAFVLPQPERYYSFDWGNVHFVAIDTTHRDKDQLVWLDEDLTKNRLPWVIVFGHHPMYTNSLRGPQMWIRKAFAKILTRHKVDIVMTGHEHHYERFRIGGVNYIVSGGGGGTLTRLFGSQYALKQATVHHFLSFEVTATTLDMKAIDIAGEEIESLRLTKDVGGVKVKVDGTPDERQNPITPEKTTVPDEKVHDEPDDDTKKEKVPPAPAPAPKTEAPPVKPL